MSRRGSRQQALYRGEPQGVRTGCGLSLVSARGRAARRPSAGGGRRLIARLLKSRQTWKKPVFPLKGARSEGPGREDGPELGELLRGSKNEWIDSGFSLTRDALIERAAEYR